MHKTNIILSVATALSLSCVLGAQLRQDAYAKASNTDSHDLFGYSVAVSGNTMVVGAPREGSKARGVNGDQTDNSALHSGAAYVFVRSGGTWIQQAYLKASNADAHDWFGYSVSISGDTVVVGANREFSSATGVNGDQANNSASFAGAAYVFVRSSGVWSQQAYLKASNTDARDQFGWSVATSGDTVVVGAIYEASNATGINGAQRDNSAGRAGSAYVFVRSAGVWTQQAYLKASNTDAYDEFGDSVTISDDVMVVGAKFEDSKATGVNGDQANNSAGSAGAAYVFVRTGSTWSQQAYLKASNTDTEDWFGHSVSISDDTVVVGARNETSNATGVNGDQKDNSADDAGAAYVFVRIAGVWTQQAYLKASNTDEYDIFGCSVTISDDIVVVGAYAEDSSATGVNGDQSNNGASFAGAAYVFVRSSSAWSQQAYLKASNTDENDIFGWSVSISGDTVVAGAYGETSNATGVNGDQSNNSVAEAGAAYVFSFKPPTMEWEKIASTVSPPDRARHAMAFDPVRQRTLLFGGLSTTSSAYLGDTWEWDGKVWTQLNPSSAPLPRFDHAIVYDSARQRIVLFGGQNGIGVLEDTWEWDGNLWVPRLVQVRPKPRYGHAMAYDSARKRTVVFGGRSGSKSLGDTWEWDGTAWKERILSTSPVAMANFAMAYDSGRQRVVLYFQNQTWEWDGTSWLQRSTTASPGGKLNHAMVYDSNTRRVLLLGDLNPTHWEWDGYVWTAHRPIPSLITPIWSHAMAFDSVRERTVLFGGYPPGIGTWEYGERVVTAQFNAYGTSCGPVLDASSGSKPVIGAPFSMTTKNLSNTTTAALMSAGLSDKFISGIPLPLNLSYLGMNGCFLHHSFEATWLFPVQNGVGSFGGQIPNDTSFLGARLFFQSAADSKTSNGGEVLIGNR